MNTKKIVQQLEEKVRKVFGFLKPRLMGVLKSDFVVGLVLWFLGTFTFILGSFAVGWLWENVEAFRWLVFGVVGLVLLVVLLGLLAVAWPLLVALAALVYLGKNC